MTKKVLFLNRIMRPKEKHIGNYLNLTKTDIQEQTGKKTG